MVFSLFRWCLELHICLLTVNCLLNRILKGTFKCYQVKIG